MKIEKKEYLKTALWVLAFFAALYSCQGCSTLPWTPGEKALLGIAGIFKTADLIVTHNNLKSGGTEHNPLMRGSDERRIAIGLGATFALWGIADACKTRECRNTMLYLGTIFNAVPLIYSLEH